MTTNPNDPTLAAYTTRWQRRDHYLAGAASEDARKLLRLAFGSDDLISDTDAAFLASIQEVNVIHEGGAAPQGSVYQPRRYDLYEVTLVDGRHRAFGLVTQGYSEGYGFEIKPAPAGWER